MGWGHKRKKQRQAEKREREEKASSEWNASTEWNENADWSRAKKPKYRTNEDVAGTDLKRSKGKYPPSPGIFITSKIPSRTPRAAAEVCNEMNAVCNEQWAQKEQKGEAKTKSVSEALAEEIDNLQHEWETSAFKNFGEEPARGISFIRRQKDAEAQRPSEMLRKMREKKDVNFKYAVKIVPIDYASSAHMPSFEKLVETSLPLALEPYDEKLEWNLVCHVRNMTNIKHDEIRNLFTKYMPKTRRVSGSDPDIRITVEVTPMFAGFCVTPAAESENEFKFKQPKNEDE